MKDEKYASLNSPRSCDYKKKLITETNQEEQLKLSSFQYK
jgi:hypothetical protein